MPTSPSPHPSNRARAGLDRRKGASSAKPSSSKAASRGHLHRPAEPKSGSSDAHSSRLINDDKKKHRSIQQKQPAAPLTPEELPAVRRRSPIFESDDEKSALVRRGEEGRDSSSSSSPEPPLNILGVQDGDPFDICPLPSERRARELLSLYVGTDSFTTAAVQHTSMGKRFETELRRERWFPLALRSKAGYAGLIAYLETGQDNPLQQQTELYRRHYLSVGLKELTEALRDPTKILQNETAFSVLMFLAIALQLRDFEAVRFHAEGLFRIVCERARAAGEEPPLVQVRLRAGYEDTGVPGLVQRGLISQQMADILRCNLILSQYTSAYSRDYVAGFGTGHHIWKAADFPKDMNAVENGIMTAFRIFIRRVATKNPLTVSPQTLTSTLQRYLQSCDLERLWNDAPYLVLWMALVAGPASEGECFEYFVRLLKETQARTFTWSFQAAVQLCSQLFFWSPSLNTTSEQYWDRVISTSEMPGPYQTPMTPPPSDAATDALEKPPTMQVAVAMRGPRVTPPKKPAG